MNAKERLVFEAEPTLTRQIDDWRFANRMPSRAEAIRQLVISQLAILEKKRDDDPGGG